MSGPPPIRAAATLEDMSWQVKEGDQPAIVMNLAVRDARSSAGGEPALRNESFEISPSMLDSVLSGLGKIRDQLEKV